MTPARRGDLPGDDVVGGEDQVEEARVVQVAGGEPAHGDVGAQVRRGAAEDHDGHAGAGLPAVGGDGRPGERRGVGLEEMEEGGHQKTMNREAAAARAPISAAPTRTTGCPSVFQPGSAGMAEASTWKEMPSFLRAARNFSTSSPSTRSSVSSSSRWAPAPASTMVTGFSPATTPRAMRIASLARWETRGSSEMTTRTGWPATRSVERQEPVGAVDDVGQDDQAAVGGAVGQR